MMTMMMMAIMMLVVMMDMMIYHRTSTWSCCSLFASGLIAGMILSERYETIEDQL